VARLGPPQNLRVEGLSPASEDVVLSEVMPRFGFHHAPLAAPVPFGVAQASYPVTVSARSDGERLLWDSGHVASNASSEIVYGGQQGLGAAAAAGTPDGRILMKIVSEQVFRRTKPPIRLEHLQNL
jgi:hypothetical protein